MPKLKKVKKLPLYIIKKQQKEGLNVLKLPITEVIRRNINVKKEKGIWLGKFIHLAGNKSDSKHLDLKLLDHND